MTTLKVKAHGLALGIALLTLAAGAAHADSVRVKGTTSGCYTCTDTASYSSPVVLHGQTNGVDNPDATLTFVGDDFDLSTSTKDLNNDGILDNRGLSLGEFSLTDAVADYSSPFQLMVDFQLPIGMGASDPAIYSALLTGEVKSTDDGGVYVDFNPFEKDFFFSYTRTDGSIVRGNFTLGVNDTSIEAGQTALLNGYVRGSQTVPEAGSLALFLPGFAAAGLLLRRRRSSR